MNCMDFFLTENSELDVVDYLVGLTFGLEFW
jgi:hypothetical protein